MPDRATTVSRNQMLFALDAHRALLVAELAAVDRFLANYEEEPVTVQPEPAPITNHQPTRAERMIAVLQSPTTANRNGIASYINHGYLTRSKKGVYTVTAKGRDKLAQLQA